MITISMAENQDNAPLSSKYSLTRTIRIGFGTILEWNSAMRGGVLMKGLAVEVLEFYNQLKKFN